MCHELIELVGGHHQTFLVRIYGGRGGCVCAGMDQAFNSTTEYVGCKSQRLSFGLDSAVRCATNNSLFEKNSQCFEALSKICRFKRFLSVF